MSCKEEYIIRLAEESGCGREYLSRLCRKCFTCERCFTCEVGVAPEQKVQQKPQLRLPQPPKPDKQVELLTKILVVLEKIEALLTQLTYELSTKRSGGKELKLE